MLDLTRPFICYIRNLYADEDDPDCRTRYIRVMIYPDVEQLRSAASKYRHGEDFSNAGGVFQPTPFTAKYNRRRKRWEDTTTSFAGVIRFCLTYLRPDVIAHEATHAALHITRLHNWAQPEGNGNARFDETGPAEEAFAYLLGNLTAELLRLTGPHHRGMTWTPCIEDGCDQLAERGQRCADCRAAAEPQRRRKVTRKG